MPDRPHFYRDVPKLGNVAVSRHALAKMEAEGVTQESFESVLLDPRHDLPDGQNVVLRQSPVLRIVVLLNPTPPRGARLVKTVYRIKAKAHAR